MTFKQLWTALKTAWTSEPFAIIIPIAAAAFWFATHGHDFRHPMNSLPTWQEFVTGSALWTVAASRFFSFFGIKFDATTPPSSSNGVGKVTILALVGALALGSSGCATTAQIIKDINATCPQLASEATQDLHLIEQIIMCDGGAGATLPACALASLGDIAAAIPGGWATIQCIADVLSKDMTKPAAVRARAAELRAHATRMQNGR